MRKAVIPVLILVPIFALMILFATGGKGPIGVRYFSAGGGAETESSPAPGGVAPEVEPLRARQGPVSLPERSEAEGAAPLQSGQVPVLEFNADRGPTGDSKPSDSTMAGQTSSGQPLSAWVEGWEGETELAVGSPAPDFILADPEGHAIRLSDYRGDKVVLLNFWATWCPPCRDEMPDFQALYEARGEDVVVLAINLRESREQVTAFFSELGLTFPALLDEDGAVFRRYLIRPMPTTYVVDKEGIISGRYFGLMSPQIMEGLVNLALGH